MTVKKYLNDRLIEKSQHDFFIITPCEVDEPMPIFCAVCDRLYRTSDDQESHSEFGCCNMCALQFAHPRRKEWHDGWRPNKENVDEMVAQRAPLYITDIIE